MENGLRWTLRCVWKMLSVQVVCTYWNTEGSCLCTSSTSWAHHEHIMSTCMQFSACACMFGHSDQNKKLGIVTAFQVALWGILRSWSLCSKQLILCTAIDCSIPFFQLHVYTLYNSLAHAGRPVQFSTQTLAACSTHDSCTVLVSELLYMCNMSWAIWVWENLFCINFIRNNIQN